MQIPSFFNPLSSSMPSEVYSENIVMSGRCAHEHSNHVTNCVPGNVIQVSITILYCHTITQVEFGWEYWCHPCECKSWDGGLKSAAFDPVADTSCVGDVVRQRRRWRRHQHIFFVKQCSVTLVRHIDCDGTLSHRLSRRAVASIVTARRHGDRDGAHDDRACGGVLSTAMFLADLFFFKELALFFAIR